MGYGAKLMSNLKPNQNENVKVKLKVNHHHYHTGITTVTIS